MEVASVRMPALAQSDRCAVGMLHDACASLDFGVLLNSKLWRSHLSAAERRVVAAISF